MQNDPLLVYRLGQLLVDEGLIRTARADDPLGVHRLPDVEYPDGHESRIEPLSKGTAAGAGLRQAADAFTAKHKLKTSAQATLADRFVIDRSKRVFISSPN